MHLSLVTTRHGWQEQDHKQDHPEHTTTADAINKRQEANREQDFKGTTAAAAAAADANNKRDK